MNTRKAIEAKAVTLPQGATQVALAKIEGIGMTVLCIGPTVPPKAYHPGLKEWLEFNAKQGKLILPTTH